MIRFWKYLDMLTMQTISTMYGGGKMNLRKGNINEHVLYVPNHHSQWFGQQHHFIWEHSSRPLCVCRPVTWGKHEIRSWKTISTFLWLQKLGEDTHGTPSLSPRGSEILSTLYGLQKKEHRYQTSGNFLGNLNSSIWWRDDFSGQWFTGEWNSWIDPLSLISD